MGENFTVKFKGDHIRIDTDAERNLDNAVNLWTEVAKTCTKHSCYRVLGVSNAPGPMPTMDGFAHADLFRELKIDGKFRIAWAELNDKAREATFFVETVLFNRGLPGKVFAAEEEARTWLFSDSGDKV